MWRDESVLATFRPLLWLRLATRPWQAAGAGEWRRRSCFGSKTLHCPFPFSQRNMGILRSPYDAKAFKAAAETIRAHSGATLSALFDGSGTAAGSKASPSIETDLQEFDKLANDLGIYASALSVAADRNPDMLGPGTRMQTGDAMGGGPLARKVDAARDAASMPAEHASQVMLQTCKSCHAKFRIEAK